MLFIFINQQDLSAQFYNGTQTSFGKNRIQYQDFQWQFYRFQKFETFFYTGGQKIAEHTAYYANKRINQLEQFLDYYVAERIEFVIFNKQSHFRQSNIGLASKGNHNIGGYTNIIDYKVFIYFDGDYQNLKNQIDEGILRVLINQMVYGGNWREVLKNSALMTLPKWYVEGLISYLVYPNDQLIKAQIKDGVLNDEFKKFNSLNHEKSRIAGHAMWEYIANTYGQNMISNILYMTKISREIDDGFLYVIGVSFKDLHKEWSSFYKEKYTATPAEELGESLDLKIKKRKRYQNFKISPNGRYFTYTTNHLGKYKIYIYDKETKKKKKIFSGDHKLERIQDYSYPVVNFHPTSEVLAFFIEAKNEIYLYQYSIKNKFYNSKIIHGLDKVLSFDYKKNGQEMIFSAVYEGQSDLYLYNLISNSQKALTNDVYADLSPVFNEDDSKIFFTSNRPHPKAETLNSNSHSAEFIHQKDIFVYDLKNKKEPISSVTNTPNKSEFLPTFNNDYLHYLTYDEERTSRIKVKYDSTVSHIDTIIHYKHFYKTIDEQNFGNTILEYNNSSYSDLAQLSYLDQSYQLYFQEKNYSASQQEKNSKQVDYPTDIPSLDDIQQRTILQAFKKRKDENSINFKDYSFEKKEEKHSKPQGLAKTEIDDFQELKFPTQRMYRLNFRPDNSIIQLNNMFITEQYQQFNGGPYINAGLGVNTKIGIVDLMENHRIYGGFRYSGDLIEYSLSYQNLTKRLNKEYSVSRRRLRETNTPFPFDVKTLQANLSLTWPFNEVAGLSGVISARNDKNIPLSSNQFNLERDITNNYWASVKAAYIFDNTRDIALNIMHGTRYKVFAEQYQLVYAETPETSKDLTVFGFDFRHYQEIHKELIGVFRFAGSKSLGTNPLIYYMGGVDEWWKSNIFDRNTPIDYGMNYGFQALAANMRGFLQNVRNGNNFAVINTELRFPVFSYLINRPIQSSFIRNFQIVGFGDVGTAWVGNSPFSKDNPIVNESQITGPIKVTYKNINHPIVGSTGFGLRTTLLGYFVRLDWGWGIENGRIADKPLFMFSLSLDI